MTNTGADCFPLKSNSSLRFGNLNVTLYYKGGILVLTEPFRNQELLETTEVTFNANSFFSPGVSINYIQLG